MNSDFELDSSFVPRMRVLSLGVGVQSSDLLLRSARGELPLLDCAIFADTHHEPRAVYEYLHWLETQVPFPIYRVSAGDLLKSATRVRTSRKTGNKYIQTAIPIYLADGLRKGIGKRHCTRDFKINPIRKKVRELLGIKRIAKNHPPIVEMWIGISTDEMIRMKPSEVSFIRNRWPHIEADRSRFDILADFDRLGLPRPPRSACVFCPFHDDAEWTALTEEEFADAVAAERSLQEAYAKSSIEGTPYLHDSRVPLNRVALKPKAKAEQLTMRLGRFANECEGMCGV